MPAKGHKVSEETRQKMIAARAKHKPHVIGRYGITEEIYNAEIAAGRIFCSDCKRFRGREFFGNDVRKVRCRDCGRDRCKDHYANNRESRLAFRRKYYRDNLELEKHRGKARFFKKFGADHDWYEKTLSDQGGCAICSAQVPDSRSKFFFVDHKHGHCANPKGCQECVRGLLCGRCNSSLERIESDPDWGIKALAYLARCACLKESS